MSENAQADRIQDLTNRLNQVTAHPAFQNLLTQLQALPADQRPQYVRDHMNVTALAALGIPIPPGLRSVVRVFETPAAAIISDEAQPTGAGGAAGSTSRMVAAETTVCVSAGVVVCASVGSSTN